jgi:transposase
MFRKKDETTMFRAVKFEIRPTEKQLTVLNRISGICRKVWNNALSERNQIFDAHMRPIYEAIKETTEKGDGNKVAELRQQLKRVYEKHPLPTYIDQQNALTDQIPQDPELQLILRAWIEQALVELHGVIKSFLKLRKKGDPDARPPRMKGEGFFCDISGRSGFKVDLENGTIRLSTNRIAEENFVFPIPDYQQKVLAQAVKIKDFTLFRDERDLTKPGRFWISLAYSIPKPETKEFVPEDAVFVALGATKIGVVVLDREEAIPLGRPDMHWQPKIERVKTRMKGVQKGSRKWKRLNVAKRRMETLMSRQQKQNRREIVQKLLRLGEHFVVTELVVRSKLGKLADKRKPERGGVLGLNWTAQNSGAFGELIAQLVIKATEKGGTVTKHPMPPISRDSDRANKVQAARLLREHFLASRRKSAG